MASTLRNRILQILGATLLVTLSVGYGSEDERTEIRTATIGGVTGPVYYSVVDRRYHAIGHAIGKPDSSGQQLAEAASLKP